MTSDAHSQGKFQFQKFYAKFLLMNQFQTPAKQTKLSYSVSNQREIYGIMGVYYALFNTN